MNKRQLDSPESEVKQAEKIRKMPNQEIKEMLDSFKNELKNEFKNSFKSDVLAVVTETNEEVKKIGKMWQRCSSAQKRMNKKFSL